MQKTEAVSCVPGTFQTYIPKAFTNIYLVTIITMSRHLLTLCFFAMLFCKAYPQSAPTAVPATYDIAKKRLLARSVTQYIYTVSQGQLDPDSAAVMACKIYGFSRLLPYNENYSDGKATAGSTLIDAGKIAEAKNLAPTLTGETQIQLMIELATYYLYKPGADKQDIDNALSYIQQAGKLSTGQVKWQNECLTLLGQLYFQSGNFPESQKNYALLIKSCEDAKDEKGLAAALMARAKCLPYNDPQHMAGLQQSKEIFHRLNMKERECNVLSEITIFHFMFDKPQAEKDLHEMLDIQNAINYKHLHYAYSTLSFLTDLRGDYIDAIAYAEQSLKYLNDTKDFAMEAPIYLRLGAVYSQLGRSDEGIVFFEKGLRNKSKERQVLWYKSFFSLVGEYINQGKGQQALDTLLSISADYPPSTMFDQMHLLQLKGGCYERLGQNKLAEENFDAFTTMAAKFPPQFIYAEMPEAYYAIAFFHYKLGHIEKTRQYLQMLVSLPPKNMSLHALRGIQEIYYKLDSAAGNYQSAFQHHQAYKFYDDSLFSQSQVKQVNELMAKYENEKKDQNIKLLTEQDKLQKVELRQSNLTRNITFAGIALLLAFLALLYRQYSAKQKSNKEISEKNIALQQLVDEKEWLLKEIHHRVKNNLQTIVSLLESQSAYLQDDALLALQDSQNRVFAMSLIHQKLYHSDNVAAINMASYLPELLNYLRDSFNVKQQIQFNLQIPPLELDVSQAVPIGLILNEAITNAIKYAFPLKDISNTITISMEQHEASVVQLTVSDNGIGLPDHFDQKKSAGLGLKLMKGLTEDIAGNFSIRNSGGTTIAISFIANTPLHKSDEATLSKLVSQPA